MSMPTRRGSVSLTVSAALAAALSPACAPVDDAADAGPPADAAVPDGWTDPDLNPELIALRPYGLRIPASAGEQALPLVVTLHGFGSSAAEQVAAFDLINAAEQRGFVLAYPDGTEVRGSRAWNASCCGALPLSVDDVAYLRAVIADAASHTAVDRRRIFVHGMSNGAFMAHLFACQAADLVAAIVAVAGTMWVGEDVECQPSQPVAVLHAHGTADATVAYDGGTFIMGMRAADYISAPAVVEVWRERNGCSAATTMRSADYVPSLAGVETDVALHSSGCQDQAEVARWTVNGGEHVSAVNQAFLDDSLDFLLGHPKP